MINQEKLEEALTANDGMLTVLGSRKMIVGILTYDKNGDARFISNPGYRPERVNKLTYIDPDHAI